DKLVSSSLQTFEDGILSEDLAILCNPSDVVDVPDNTGLIAAIRDRLEKALISA
ncbi:MAG: hypothetical protein K0S60_20, partial [Evtepia sp.]|nr:hypothetical protein [Evtepia sp.]